MQDVARDEDVHACVGEFAEERERLAALAESLLQHESLDHDEILRVTNLPPKDHSGRIDPAAIVPEPVLHSSGSPEL